MSEPFLAEVRIVGFNFAPRGWALCDGQILPINQNQALFSLLGTTYGGDGRTSFALPDLRGRTPIHPGDSFVNLGSKAGEENVALSTDQIPQHGHQARASSSDGDVPVPQGFVLASSSPNEIYAEPSNLVPMRSGTVANAGQNRGHENRQPFLVVNYIIALQGVFPSRN